MKNFLTDNFLTDIWNADDRHFGKSAIVAVVAFIGFAIYIGVTAN